MCVLSIDRKKTLPPARGHVTRYSFTSSFMTRGTVNWSQTKLVFSLQCCKLTSHALPALLTGVEDIVCQEIICILRALNAHALPSSVPDYH